MLEKPVSVIKGSAGTGKTEVATTVWKVMSEKMTRYYIYNINLAFIHVKYFQAFCEQS